MSRGFPPLSPALILAVLLITVPVYGGVPRGISVNAGDQVTSGIQPVGDSDVYVFDGLAGGLLTLQLAPAIGSDLTPTVSVLDPDGSPMDVEPYLTVRKGKVSVKKLPLTMTGRHALVVVGDDGTTGAYVLKTKAKWPKKRVFKKVPLGARETKDFLFPGFGGVPVSIAVKDRGKVGFSIASLTDPDGNPISTATLVAKKHSVKGRLTLKGPLGDYCLQVAGAGAETVIDVKVKLKVPKVEKRKLDITSLEPVITGLVPNSAWTGDQIAIAGENFAASDVTVLFGEWPSPDVIEAAADDVRAKVPDGEGEVKILVINPDGQWAESEGRFTFVSGVPFVTRVTPAYGPDTGGTSVTVDGRDLAYIETIRLGGIAVSSVPTIISDEKLTFTTDAHDAGIVDIELVDRWGQTRVVNGGFTFFGPPEIDSVSPRTGTTKGGTQVTVTGAWFRPEDTVHLDGEPVTGFTYLGTTSFGFVTKEHTIGSVDLLVRDQWGRETVLRGAFEYTTVAIDDLTDSSVPANEGSAIYGGRAVVVSDFDGDGDLDLAFGRPADDGDGPFTTLLVNDGTGKFTGGTMPDPTSWADAWAASDIAVGDMNGDGHEDLVLTSEQNFADPKRVTWFVGKVPHEAHSFPYSSTRLLLNDGKGGFELKKDAFPDPQAEGTDLLAASAIALHDLDGDGSLDVVLTSTRSVMESSFTTKVLASVVHLYYEVAVHDDRPATRVLLNDGKGTFKDVTAAAIPEVEAGDMFAGDDVVVGDVNDDGEPDIVLTGENVDLRNPKQPQYVAGSRTRILLNDGKALFTNATAKLMPTVLDGDDWGGRGLWLGDLDGDKRRDDLIVTTTRALSADAEKATYDPSTRVFTGSDRGFVNATADWLPHIRSDGQGDVHRGTAALAVNLAADRMPSIFLVNAAPVLGWDEESGSFERQISSLRWFRHTGEMPLSNVSETQLPDPEARKDWYYGHAFGFGDLNGDGSLELIVTTDHADMMKEGRRPTRILTTR